MKPIQMSGATMGRIVARTNESADAGTSNAPESFSENWTRELGSAERSAGNDPAPGVTAPRDEVAKQSAGAAEAAYENLSVHASDEHAVDAKVSRQQSASRAGAIERHPHGTASLASGSIVRTKHRATAKPEIRSSGSQINGSGLEVTVPVAARFGAPASMHASKCGVTDAAKAQKAQTALYGGATRPAAQESAFVAAKPAAAAIEEEVRQPVVQGKSVPTAHPPVAVKKALAASGPPAEGTSVALAASQAVPIAGRAPQPASPALSVNRVGPHLTDASAGAAMNRPMPQTIVSTPTQLDVGIFNGMHGWLRVRAELGAAGAVNASVTVIDAAHDALRATVPEIANYLGVESVKVDSIAVHRFADGADGLTGSMTDSHQGEGQKSNQQGDNAHQQEDQAARSLSLSLSHDSPLLDEATALTSNTENQMKSVDLRNPQIAALAAAVPGRGTWLNVCA